MLHIGELVVNNGSHEARVYDKVPLAPEKCQLSHLLQGYSDSEKNFLKVGFSKAVKLGWLKVVDSTYVMRVVRSIVDQVLNTLTPALFQI